MPDFDAAELEIIARLVLKEHARLESMLDGLSPDASDRARLEPEMARLSALYNKAS
jgi:hypothetical protein